MKKINDALQFGLELDISMFSEKPEIYENEEERIYELAGVLIHNGDPYSGHYHAYIRDQLKEGDWEKKFGELMALKEKKKLEKEGKSENPQQIPSEKDNTGNKVEENVVNNEANFCEAKDKEVEGENIAENGKQEEKNIENASTDEEEKAPQVHEPKHKKKKNKGKKKQGKNKNRKRPYATTSGYTKKKEEEKKEFYDDTIKDDVEFPVPFSNKELSNNWFDFNDSTVKPIPANRIQIQFGGNSSENAYILLYRQKALVKDPHFKKKELDGYLKKSIDAQNEGLEKIRTIYKNAEAELELIFIDPGLINVRKQYF